MKFCIASSFLEVSFACLNFFYIVFAKENASNANNGIHTVQIKWLTHLFLEAEMNFDIDPAASSQCYMDFSLYKEHLKAQSGWAVRMLESSEWPTTGLLAGRTTHLGNWDECLLISTHDMRGKYCLVEGSYDYDRLLKNNSTKVVEWPSDELTVWEILHMFEKNQVRVHRKTVRWALCVPSSCSSSDLEISLKKIIHPLFQNQNMDFQLHGNQSSCHEKDEIKYPDEYYYAVMFFRALFLLVCLSTIYDTFRKPKQYTSDLSRTRVDSLRVNERSTRCENTEMKELFLSFSLRLNTRQLFQYSEKSDYGMVYGMKFVSMVLVIFAHRRIYLMGYPSFNPETTERNFKKGLNYLDLTHHAFVDIFFMLTGFLTFHLNFSSMSKNGFRYWIVAIIHRWMRMVPASCTLLLFFVFIFPYIGDGPLWNERISYEVNHCFSSWWTNLLALNNVIQTGNQCLVVSWYVAADLQLSVVGFGLLYITSKSRSQGWIAVILTFVLGAAVTFFSAYVNKFHGILPAYSRLLQDPYSVEDFINFYIAFYTRIGPYAVGIIAALITKVLKEKNFKFSTLHKFIGIILGVTIAELYLYLGFVIEYEFGREYNVLEHAFYAATHRSVFVITPALALCMYFTTGFSSLSGAYENCLIAALGRLTYSVFLLNTIIQLYHAASQKAIFPDSNLVNRIWWVSGDTLFSYGFGACVYLFLEAPIANVSKIVKRRLLKLNSNSNTDPTKTKMNTIRT